MELAVRIARTAMETGIHPMFQQEPRESYGGGITGGISETSNATRPLTGSSVGMHRARFRANF